MSVFDTLERLDTLERTRIEGVSFLSWAVAEANPVRVIGVPTKLGYVRAVCKEEKDMA